MENLLFTIYVVLVIVAIALVWVQARAMGKAFAHAQEAELKIFGSNYRSLTHLYADIGFMNALWSGKAISNSDPELQVHLKRARFGLRWSVAVGLLMFFGMLALGFTNAT